LLDTSERRHFAHDPGCYPNTMPAGVLARKLAHEGGILGSFRLIAGFPMPHEVFSK